MKDERERAGIQPWTARPYGGASNRQLAQLVATEREIEVEERAAAAADAAARALAARLKADQETGQSRGHRETAPIYVLLDQTDEHLVAARAAQAREAAAAKVAAAADEHLRVLAQSEDKGRLALRLAGTSRKEHRELTQQAKADRATGWGEAADARRDASHAAEAAWSAVRDSPYASPLKATPHQAPDVDTLAARLTEMRETLVPARAQQIDTGDQRRLSRLHGQAAKARENAATYRQISSDARTEQTLRARLADQHPKLHQTEVQARAQIQQAKRDRAERIQQQNQTTYQPPAPTRSGPSLGR
ncbi:hypothetical protein ACFU5Z_32175 [Streptomyces sp. NPDC057521]|uniref:hypothetical protein n=1 Tax=Streptomyces sp. NPDC057521 TaxID=3346156 RepID=UPI0036A1FD7B